MIIGRYFDSNSVAKQFNKQCVFRKDKKKQPSKGVKTMLINNILCFVEWDIHSDHCTFTIHSKLRPEPLMYKVTEMYGFNLHTEMKRLEIVFLTKSETLEAAQDQLKSISQQESDRVL